MATQLFKKYYTRLAKEGWLKATFCALIVGFATVLVSASVIYWAMGSQKMLWLAAIIGLAVAGGVLPLFYFTKFRPSDKEIMQRIDELGLEERMITMKALEGDNSYMAQRQREDAMKALKTMDSTMLKFAVSIPLVIALSIVAVASVGTTTVYATAKKSGKAYIEEAVEKYEESQLEEYEITYEVEGDGEIIGEIIQLIKEGESGEEVFAEPMEGWVFGYWKDAAHPDFVPAFENDPALNPYHTATEVKRDVVYIAVFIEAEEGGDPDDKEPSDKEGEPSDEESDAPPQDDDNPPPPKDSPDGGGTGEDNDNWKDGETPSVPDMGPAGDTAAGEVAGNGNIGGDAGDVIGGYFGSFAG